MSYIRTTCCSVCHPLGIEQMYLFIIRYFIKAHNRQSEPANVRGWMLAIIALLERSWSQPIWHPSKTSRAVVQVRSNLVSYLILIYVGILLSLSLWYTLILIPSLFCCSLSCLIEMPLCLSALFGWGSEKESFQPMLMLNSEQDKETCLRVLSSRPHLSIAPPSILSTASYKDARDTKQAANKAWCQNLPPYIQNKKQSDKYKAESL